jgi:hypothetical protein
MKEFVSLMEFNKKCEKADFYYQEKQNFRKWREGQKEYAKLIDLSYQSPLQRKLWEEHKKLDF